MLVHACSCKDGHFEGTLFEFILNINCTFLYMLALFETIHLFYNATLLEVISDVLRPLCSFRKMNVSEHLIFILTSIFNSLLIIRYF